MKKSMPVAKSAPAAAPAVKRPAAIAVAGAGNNPSASDPMLMDTYQQSDDSTLDVGNDLDDFDARLSNPQKRAAGPARLAPKRTVANAQFKAHQAPAKAPPPVVFRKPAGSHGPALTEDNDDTRDQDVQDVRNLGADCHSDDD